MQLFLPRKMTLWLILVGLVGRFVLAAVIGLGVDESYVRSGRPLF